MIEVEFKNEAATLHRFIEGLVLPVIVKPSSLGLNATMIEIKICKMQNHNFIVQNMVINKLH